MTGRDTPCYGDAGRCTDPDVTLYPSGRWCAAHAPPAAPTPDPDRTVAGLRARTLPAPNPSRYGTARTDPLGRTGKPRSGIPTRPKD